MLKQQVHGPHVVLLASDMERCEAVLETRGKNGSQLDKTCVVLPFDLKTV